MSVSNSKNILIKAAKGKYAVGAFNITSISQLQAVVEASEAACSPLIIQTSVGTVEMMGAKLLVAAFRAIAEDVSIPVALHLDHCTDVEFCKKCIDACIVGAVNFDDDLPNPIICKHCGICAQFCPHQCLTMEEV